MQVGQHETSETYLVIMVLYSRKLFIKLVRVVNLVNILWVKLTTIAFSMNGIVLPMTTEIAVIYSLVNSL